MTRLAWFVASLGGLGTLRPAPGTIASAAVLPLALLGPVPCLLLAAALTILGLWATSSLPQAREDPGWIVVDEAAGQCLALACLPASADLLPIALAFALFRVLDITKPGPIGWADRLGGGLGVMLDDVLAGAIAGGVLLAARAAGWMA